MITTFKEGVRLNVVEKHVSVDRLIRIKNPSLSGLAFFLTSAVLKIVLKERLINSVIEQVGDVSPFEFARKVLKILNITLVFVGLEKLQNIGKVTICANHPTGAVDGLALLLLLEKLSGRPQILVNDILFDLPILSEYFWPLNKFASNIKAMTRLDNLYAAQDAIALFPAGRTARPSIGFLRELAWEKSFVKLSRKHNRSFFPVKISGANSKFFYGLWRWRNRLGIKANLEMFFLVREFFKKKNQTITITVGDAIEPGQCSGKNSFDLAQDLRILTEHLSPLEPCCD